MPNLYSSSYFDRLNVKRVISVLGKVHWTPLYPWEQGQHLGRRSWPMVTCAGELLCRNEGSRMSLTCQVSQGTQVPQRTGRILPENQTETLPGRRPQQQRWDTGSQGWNSGRPGWEVSGSGWTDVQCQGSSAWSEAAVALYTMPGVTLGSWVNTTPTYGPRWP